MLTLQSLLTTRDEKRPPSGKATVYRMVFPDGRQYIGVTRTTLRARIRGHLRVARENNRRPIAQALRRFDPGQVCIESLAVLPESAAYALEHELVALYGTQIPDGYNATPGGEVPPVKAVKEWWASLKADPEAFAEYRERLRQGAQTEAHRAHQAELVSLSAQWREANPEEAERISLRNLALASARRDELIAAGEWGSWEIEWTEEMREAAAARMIKRWAAMSEADVTAFRERSRRHATRQWRERTPEQRAAVAAKISASLKRRNASRTHAEKAAADAQLAQARKHIDHDKRKAAQRAVFDRLGYMTSAKRAQTDDS